MEEFIRIGKQLREKKKTVKGLESRLTSIISNKSGIDVCDELIKACLIAEVDCMPLIEISKEENHRQCGIVLNATLSTEK